MVAKGTFLYKHCINQVYNLFRVQAVTELPKQECY